MKKINSAKKLLIFVLVSAGILFCSDTVVFCGDKYLSDYEKTQKLFKNPPREYANAPLWVWNDMLTKEQIIKTMRDLASQNVKQVFVHPRPGLMTPYLSKEWFDLWNTALQEAKRLDMNVWIYDENSYPSGFAGGWVPELMPESRGRGLVLKESPTPPKWSTNTIAIFKIEKDNFIDITTDIIRGKQFPEGSYIEAAVRRTGNSPWTANRCYVDLLYPGVTEKFLEVTHESYKKHFGYEFGKRIPGSFTDEPEITPAGGLPWTDDLNYQFKKRWGYSLVENLPSLYKEVGDWQRVRHNYYATLLDLFIERWAKPYFEYCSSNRLEFTGHYWEHEWPNCKAVPDNMAMAAWQHRPGIDILMNRYEEHTHAQFGNIRSCKEISSIANQLGKKRTLVEVYGAGGWDLRFEDMKRIGDWLLAHGVNTLDEHLSYISIRGARKRDHPQSFSYHEPWWDSYHVVATYFKRLSAIMSQGEQVNKVLVIEPTTTAWMYQGNPQMLEQIGGNFFNFLKLLEANQIEYDLGCEDVIARNGDVKDNEFKVGRRFYHTVIIPPLASKNINIKSPELNLNRQTYILLERFAVNGGRLITCDSLPERIDGKKVPQLAESQLIKRIHKMTESDIVAALKKLQEEDGFCIVRDENDRGILFHNRRILPHGQFVFLVNTSLDYESKGMVYLKNAYGYQKWDPVSCNFTWGKDGQDRCYFTLPPGGSLLLYFPTEKSVGKLSESFVSKSHSVKSTEVHSKGETIVRRLQPNVLTVDYVDINIKGESFNDVYFYKANQLAFKKNGMERNPWDSAVQFKDELIKIQFPENSGFTVTYKFTIDGKIPDELEVVIENPKIYKKILVNGHEVKANPKKWWLDKSFGRIPIQRFAKTGLNTVTLEASPMTIYHEIEPIYVLGNFWLKPAEKGFVIVEDKPIKFSMINPLVSFNDRSGSEGKANEANVNELRHGINPDGTMWLTAGIGVGTQSSGDDKSPFIVFDLGNIYNLSGIKIWNYNENHVKDLTLRGVKRMRVLAGTTIKSGLEYNLGEFTLEKANGEKSLPQTIKIDCQNIRYIKFEILENHAGVVYPPVGIPPDNGFVGLAEVVFLDNNGRPIKNVSIYSYSSELTSHRRLARYVIDKSGLEPLRLGWNSLGHPFYANGFGYTQSYFITNTSANYEIELTDWYGSVAKVYVNKKHAGTIWSQPWKCDITKYIKYGENEVEVVVIGTLKNTLGPHHGNPGLGSAWPAMFHVGPEPGPPPGSNYSTVAYGLFEPFKLIKVE